MYGNNYVEISYGELRKWFNYLIIGLWNFFGNGLWVEVLWVEELGNWMIGLFMVRIRMLEIEFYYNMWLYYVICVEEWCWDWLW